MQQHYFCHNNTIKYIDKKLNINEDMKKRNNFCNKYQLRMIEMNFIENLSIWVNQIVHLTFKFMSVYI
jgi:hypothetical protein